MMDLRKCTNHPYLIEYPLTDCGVYYLVDDNIVEKSGKMKVLDQMVQNLLERGHKILIFSQMTRLLDILGDYLNYKVNSDERFCDFLLKMFRLGLDLFSPGWKHGFRRSTEKYR